MGRYRRWIAVWACAATCLLSAACSDGDGQGSQVDDGGPRIVGQVRDQLTGEPIRDATLSTDPPTEQDLTDVDGRYTLRGTAGDGGRFRILVDHVGYLAAHSDVAVSDGEIKQADFTLTREASGLVTSVSSLQIPSDASTRTFRLTSTVSDLGWSITTPGTRLVPEPRQGRLSRGEIAFVTVSARRSELQDSERASAELILNAVGLDGVVIDVLVDPAADATGARQSDCRLLDILRVGFEEYEAPLVRFPATARLPFDQGPRFIELPAEALFDSFIVDQPGDVTITHVQGGLAATTLELFELDADGVRRVLGRNAGLNDTVQRARVTQGLVPGVYCYSLAGTTGPFTPVASLFMQLDFAELP